MENFKNERLTKEISLLLLLLITSSFAQNETQSPEDVVREFYDALSRKDCKRAIELRPSYSDKSCKIVENVNVYTVNLVEQNHKYAL